MPRLSLLLPTRGRPRLVERLFQSIIDTAYDLKQVEVILCVDDDDLDSHGLGHETLNVTRLIGPRAAMGVLNTKCLKAASGDIIVLVNDDMVFRTGGWDTTLIHVNDSYPDGIYLAYGNDLLKKGDLCTFPILSRRTCDLLIEPYPPEYRGAFIDVHLFDVFKRLAHKGFDRIVYRPDVVLEHLHFRAGKAAADATYTSRGRFADDQTFVSLIASRAKSAAMLAAVLRGEAVTGYRHQPADPESVPPHLLAAFGRYTRVFLFDTDLPLRWRAYLWAFYTGRYMLERGMLWPFKR